MSCRAQLLVIVVLLCAANVRAQNARDTAVRQDRATLADDSTWLYDDFDKAIDVAARSKRPLMVVFR